MFSLHFWALHARSAQGFGSSQQDPHLSVLPERLITGSAPCPFSLRPPVTHNIAVNFKCVNKMFTIVAFAQLCTWDSFAFYSDCKFSFPLSSVLPIWLAASEETHEQEFQNQFCTAQIYQLKRAWMYLIHGKAQSLAVSRTTAGCSEMSWQE